MAEPSFGREGGSRAWRTADEQIERTMLRLLEDRGAGKTICPSEVARAVAGSDEESAWRPWMSVVREVAERLVSEKKIVVTQSGEVVDGRTAKGPVRLRLPEVP